MSKFYDDRLGQSTTLSGRCIVRHMNAQINQIITGKYDYKGDAIYLVDTDSSYFSAYEIWKNDPEYTNFEWTRENIIELYDEIAVAANETFCDFMVKTFNTSPERGAIIKAGRELVASKGLFIKKKKYAVLIYDLEGARMDKDGKPGKLKAMGLDLKRADTPKFMQQFLEKILMSVLQGENQKTMYEAVKEFRREFTKRPGWEKGSPKKVSNLSKFSSMIDRANAIVVGKRGDKANVIMPGHARASINWNNLCVMNNDKYSMKITDGTRIIVCKLKANSMKIDSIAYPIDQLHLPTWFKELPFDDETMEEVIIDFKLENLVGVLNWDLSLTKDIPGSDFFDFDTTPKTNIPDDDDDED